MSREYLVAVDLEGIHGVVGEPYKTLTGSSDYPLACKNAVKEINAVVKALFDCGADKVTVWDNHGSWNNIDFSEVDARVEVLNDESWKKKGRMVFAAEHSFCGMIYLGYHAKEGSLGGVLAHTYSSVGIQYYKINGESVGEIEIDQYAAAEFGIPSILVSSDDVCISQAKAAIPGVRTVITKYGKGRNAAELIDGEEVVRALYEETVKAVNNNTVAPRKLEMPAKFEVRYTRMEDAERHLRSFLAAGKKASYGEDAHIIEMEITDINDIFI